MRKLIRIIYALMTKDGEDLFLEWRNSKNKREKQRILKIIEGVVFMGGEKVKVYTTPT